LAAPERVGGPRPDAPGPDQPRTGGPVPRRGGALDRAPLGAPAGGVRERAARPGRRSPVLPGGPMNPVVVVTGGGRGIGAATARLAGRRGYAVCVNYVHDEAAARGVAEEIRAGGGRAIAVRADVSREEEVERLFATTDRELGVATA